jgi:hypothetical protein
VRVAPVFASTPESISTMRTRTFRSCSLLLAAGLLSLTLSTDTNPTPPTSPRLGEQPSAKLSPEVRLRKLHLVRPDLIPYPIMLEVYC